MDQHKCPRPLGVAIALLTMGATCTFDKCFGVVPTLYVLIPGVMSFFIWHLCEVADVSVLVAFWTTVVELPFVITFGAIFGLYGLICVLLLVIVVLIGVLVRILRDRYR